MARIHQVGLLLLIVKLIAAQGDEPRAFPQQMPFPTARGAPDRYYYLWMNPQQPNGFQNFHGYPDHGPHHFQQQHFRGQDDPFFVRNFPNNPVPQFPPAPINPQQFPNQGREPVLFLLPPGEQPVNPGIPTGEFPLPPIPQAERTTAAPPRPSTTSQAPQTETESGTSRVTELTSTPDSLPVKNEESERSSVLFKSATSGFTNAHHYPFPIGLWSDYTKSAGLEKVEENTQEEKSPVNPRRFPSFLLVPQNQFTFALSPQQNNFADWSYGLNTQSHASLPAGLIPFDDSDDIIGEKLNGGRSNAGDSKYKFFAVPLRSVLNQVNAENENSRV